MAHLCFCIKTSCGACPDTPRTARPRARPLDTKPKGGGLTAGLALGARGRWEGLGTATADAPWALPLSSLVPGRGLHT